MKVITLKGNVANVEYTFERIPMEAEAFAAQLHGNGGLEKLETYSNELSTKYSIDRSVEVCKNKIKEFYGGYMVIYNITTNVLNFHNGTTWGPI